MSFVTQGPVPPGSPLFAGREPDLKTIDSWCKNLECVAAVMGARQTGKTSFLSKFRETCRERYSFVWVNLQSVDRPEPESVFRYIADELLQQLPGVDADMSLPVDGTSFLSFLRRLAGRTKAPRVVILMDEFGVLPADTAITLAQTLRPVFNDRFMKEEYQRYFLVLAGATDMLKLTSGDNSPLANVTRNIYLPDLTPAEAEQVLCEGWQAPNPGLCRLIYEWTAGHPYWTQLLGSCCDPPSEGLDKRAVSAIVEELLQNEDRNLPHLLKGLRRGDGVKAAAKEILRGASRTFSRANPIVAELELLGAVKNHGGHCAIRNPLYQEVLRRHLTGHADRPEPKSPKVAVATSVPAGGGHKIRMLHLSDLHLGTPEDAHRDAISLTTDLKLELVVTALDYLIISGDIADRATPAEYAAAVKFVNQIVRQFGLSVENIVLTPGNHDVNWDLSRRAYSLVSTPPKLGDEYIPLGPTGALLRDEEAYPRRFDPYLAFCAEIGRPYSSRCDKVGLVTRNEKDQILFLSLNSCWNLDHHYTERASIYPDSLSEALEQLFDGDYSGWLKIAVWHHPISGQGCMADDFLQLLTVNQFAIGMHGHIHEALEELRPYDIRRGMRIIGAGTFGAPAHQQVTGIPLQYNLLELDPSSGEMTVHSRKKDKRFGAWSADARWVDKNNPKPYYVIELPPFWKPTSGSHRLTPSGEQSPG